MGPLVLLALIFVGAVIAAAWISTRREKDKRRSKSRAGSRQAAKPPREAPTAAPLMPLTWFGAGSTLEVAGFRIVDPCVYASDPGPRGKASDPAEILLGAEVRRPEGPLPEMGYWPWYSRIAPGHRYEYLKWLATNRRELPAVEGYLFLYYYGLERRLLVDGQDRARVLLEVARLLRADAPRRGTREGESFRRYATGLLWFDIARAPEVFDDKAVERAWELTDRWNSDTLPPALAWLAGSGKPLPAAFARAIARLNPRAVQSVVVMRIREQFEALFAKRYRERFGDGLVMTVPKRLTRYAYRPASAALDEQTCSIADPMAAPAQFEPLADLWNSCVEDLRKLSKVAAPADGEVTVESWEAMPPDLRAGVEHPLAEGVHEIVAAAGAGGGECLVPAGRLAALMAVEERAKLTAGQSRRLAATVGHAGYAVEPDAQLTGRAYEWEEMVALFPPVDGAGVDAERYSGAACMLRLGLLVAEANGKIDAEEMNLITRQVQAVFMLPEHERRRLEALRAVLERAGADAAPVGKKIEQTLPLKAREAVGRLLVAIAVADGRIDKREETALRKCFRALGLGPEVLERTIAELSPGAGAGMVTVQGAEPGAAGEAIPGGGLRLNREAISAIMSETREVAKMLADAMAEGDAEEAAAPVAVAAPVEKSAGPPAQYAAFYAEIVAGERWKTADADAMARRHGLMLAGAVEAINDWAWEALGRPVLEEDGSEIVVERPEG